MLLAELEVFHSRPGVPTRRVALGLRLLPDQPAPGAGPVLLAALASTFGHELDDDDRAELAQLAADVERGRRLVQPRLRHRFQRDHIGLARSVHRLQAQGKALHYDIDDGPAIPNLLAAVYATADLRPEERRDCLAAFRKGLGWPGRLGPEFVVFVTGHEATDSWIATCGASPRRWALDLLGIAGDEPGRGEIRTRFRDLLREAHPDHGGETADAGDRIQELTEARRILLS